uniref:Uncharacterized protein n=1 Tax=Arundo donax TaxID=35708 RepID=A0A0A9GAC2_ARUDO
MSPARHCPVYSEPCPGSTLPAPVAQLPSPRLPSPTPRPPSPSSQPPSPVPRQRSPTPAIGYALNARQKRAYLAATVFGRKKSCTPSPPRSSSTSTPCPAPPRSRHRARTTSAAASVTDSAAVGPDPASSVADAWVPTAPASIACRSSLLPGAPQGFLRRIHFVGSIHLRWHDGGEGEGFASGEKKWRRGGGEADPLSCEWRREEKKNNGSAGGVV